MLRRGGLLLQNEKIEKDERVEKGEWICAMFFTILTPPLGVACIAPIFLHIAKIAPIILISHPFLLYIAPV